jgi:excisionase family DNA binding protein
MNDNLLKTDELAKQLRVSPRTIHTLRENGLPALKVGGSIRFDLQEVLAWLKAKTQQMQGWAL